MQITLHYQLLEQDQTSPPRDLFDQTWSSRSPQWLWVSLPRAANARGLVATNIDPFWNNFFPMAIREPSPDQSLAAPSLWLWGHLFAATWYQVPVAKPHPHENIMPSNQCKEFWNLMPRHCFMDSRTFARASGPAPASKHVSIHSLPWMSWSQMIEQRPFVLFKKLPCMKACIHSGWKCRWCASMCAVWYNLRHLATSDASTICPPILPTRAQLYHPSSPSISPQP